MSELLRRILKRKNFPHTQPERNERVEASQDTLRALYDTIGERLGTARQGQIHTGKKHYAIFQITDVPTGDSYLTIVRSPTPKKPCLTSYTLSENDGKKIIIRKNQLSQEAAIDIVNTGDPPDETVPELVVRRKIQISEKVETSRQGNEVLMGSMGLPDISEAEIQELVDDVTTGTFMDLPKDN